MKRRKQYGECQTLVKKLSSHEDKWFRYFRMSDGQFQHILDLANEDLEKQFTHHREPVSVTGDPTGRPTSEVHT